MIRKCNCESVDSLVSFLVKRPKSEAYNLVGKIGSIIVCALIITVKDMD